MDQNEKYMWIDTVMGELCFHKEVYEDLIGQYPEDQKEANLTFFMKGCKNFCRHPQDVLWELERDLK